MNIALWVVQGLLFLFFVASAYSHGMVPGDQAARSAPWIADTPMVYVKLIAMIELAGGIGVLLPSLLRLRPRLAPVAAVGLSLLMVSAVCFHLSRGEHKILGMLVTVGALAAFVAWGRFRKVPIGPRSAA